MSKFHVNPQTGAAGPCRAVKGQCPFGGPGDHYPSVAEAQAAFEAKMKVAHGQQLTGLRAQATVPLEAVLDPELLLRDVADGFIAFRPHHQDESLKVYCYTKNAQYAGHWTEATKVARGLILRGEAPDLSDAVVVERPWRKFFTLQQLQEGDWVLGDEEREGDSVEAELSQIDFNAPVEVTDKVDGSMGILYRAPDGLPALATKGSFGSDQAHYYTNLLRRSEEFSAAADELLTHEAHKTHLFELVGPGNRIVVDYTKEDIILLGAVEKESGRYLSAKDQGRWTGEVTETMEASTINEAFTLPDRPNREGVVIRVLSEDPRKQMQLKVKQEDYKTLHRALTNFSINDLRAKVRETPATVGELLQVAESGDITKLKGVESYYSIAIAHPAVDEVVALRKKAIEDALLARVRSLASAKAQVEALPESTFSGDKREAMKQFALSTSHMPKEEKADALAFFRARLEGRSREQEDGNRMLWGVARAISSKGLETPEE